MFRSLMFKHRKHAFGALHIGPVLTTKPNFLIITAGDREFSYKVPRQGTAFLWVFRTLTQSQCLGLPWKSRAPTSWVWTSSPLWGSPSCIKGGLQFWQLPCPGNRNDLHIWGTRLPLCLWGFKIFFDPSVTPVIHPLHFIPLAFLRAAAAARHRPNWAIWCLALFFYTWWWLRSQVHICVDPDAVYKAVRPDEYRLPTSELTAQFNGSTVILKLHLKQEYLQVLLQSSNSHLTTFLMHAGMFQYIRILFGLIPFHSYFQKFRVSVLDVVPTMVI